MRLWSTCQVDRELQKRIIASEIGVLVDNEPEVCELTPVDEVPVSCADVERICNPLSEKPGIDGLPDGELTATRAGDGVMA